MKNYRNIILLATAILAAAVGVDGQAQSSSRTNQIYRPCAGSTTPASVKITAAGGITATPCTDTGVIAGQTPSGAAGARMYLDALNGESSLEAGTAMYLSAPTVSFAASTTKFLFNRTITTAGVTTLQTINKSFGSVNVAAGSNFAILLNSTVSANSLVFALAQTNDATCRVSSAVASAGSLVLNMSANCTAETKVAFWVTN